MPDSWFDVTRNQGQLLHTDLNEDGRYELALYDANRDGYAEVAFGDNDENGLFEAGIGDPGADERYLRDTDDDGQADTWFTALAQAPGPPQQQTTLRDFYRRFAGDLVTFAPVYAGGVSAFGI